MFLPFVFVLVSFGFVSLSLFILQHMACPIVRTIYKNLTRYLNFFTFILFPIIVYFFANLSFPQFLFFASELHVPAALKSLFLRYFFLPFRVLIQTVLFSFDFRCAESTKLLFLSFGYIWRALYILQKWTEKTARNFFYFCN